MHPTPKPLAPLVSHIRSLQRLRAARDAHGAFCVEGIRHFVQAYDAGLSFEAVLDSPVLLRSRLAEMLARRLAQSGVPRHKLTPEQFRAISVAQRASGIAAIVRQRWTPLDAARPAAGSCWIVLEQIRCPGNLGTILRTAEAVGVAGVIFLGDHCDPFDPVAARASMGGLFHLRLIRTSHERFAQWLDPRLCFETSGPGGGV